MTEVFYHVDHGTNWSSCSKARGKPVDEDEDGFQGLRFKVQNSKFIVQSLRVPTRSIIRLRMGRFFMSVYVSV